MLTPPSSLFISGSAHIAMLGRGVTSGIRAQERLSSPNLEASLTELLSKCSPLLLPFSFQVQLILLCWVGVSQVLSKRWKNLLPLVDSLDLSDAIGDPRGFSAFVDTTLALLTNSSIIKRFSLSCVHTDTTQPEWTLGFALPLSDSWNFTWRAHVCTPCEVYEYLISGCPVLEELFIRYASPSECSWMVVNQSIAVSSPSIKRMSISYPSRDYWEPPATRLDLRRERVLAVEEDGIDDSSDGGWDEDVYDEDGSCFGVEHNAEVHDDVIDDDDADIDDNDAADDDSDSDSDGEDSLPDVANLVEGISNVKTLHLSPYFLEGLVHQVTDKCGDACVCIAKKKKKMEEEEKVCCLSTCQVKVLNISGYGGTGRERKQMRHFLGNLKCLETVKVGLVAENHHEDNSVNNHYQRITNALTKLPRVSSNCQIHFF
uniref:FBD domain-containing protein n=1 Tax=Brassica oleracea var. oleracea TaxID=109376 RepID=A0A0D3BTP7_BRAOL